MQELVKRMPALEGLQQAVIVTDLTGVVTYWNDAASALLGWTPQEAVGLPLSQLIALDLDTHDVFDRLTADPGWSGEMALRRRAGTAFLARVHQVPLSDDGGIVDGVLRVVLDVTEATWQARSAAERGERASRALAAGGVGAWHVDLTSGLATWDATMEALFGLEPGSFPGSRRAWLQMIHQDDREWLWEEIRKTVALGHAPVDVEYRVERSDGSLVWLHCIGHTFTGAEGAVTALTGVAFDVTERRRADEERAAFLAAERARRDRFTLLAEASGAFAETLDEAEVMAAVGKLVVPRLADWFAIDLDAQTAITTAATAHSDPTLRELVGYLGRRFGASGVVPPVGEVLADGRPRLIARADVASWSDVADNPEYRGVLSAVGVHSLIIVPLTVRGRTFGAMTLAIGESGLEYSEEDLDLAGELARRAALSMENARLFAERSHVARVLQHSLLPPELPAVPGLQVAARYRPSEAGSEIGGDFYDVFQTGSDRWTMVLGDVSGKGTDAAVLTGLARHTLRAAAIRAPGPVEVLSALNHAVMAEEYGERFVTVAYVQLTLRDGIGRLLVSSAGHPSPLVVRARGPVEEVQAAGGVIGLFADVPIGHTLVELYPRDLLVLYTDGVLEARDSNGEFYGETRLRALLSECTGSPAEEVAERVESAVMAFQDSKPRDDIAILVVRMDEPTVTPSEEPGQ